MAEPKTREQLEQTSFFKAGAEAKKRRLSLAKAISMLRPGCWQYDAFIAGYDAPSKSGRYFGPNVEVDAPEGSPRTTG